MLRKLTLNEWFLKYQLDFLNRRYNHLSAMIECDLSSLMLRFGNDKLPITSILIKCASLLLKECPQVNRQMFQSIWGKRIYSSDEFAVTVPVLFETKDGLYTSVVNIENAWNKSLDEIREELKSYRKQDPYSLPLGKFILGKENTFLNRLRLKIIHRLVNTFPSFLEKYKVGTICVTSLMNVKNTDSDIVYMAKGPGAFTLCLCGLNLQTKRMKLGISWDHGTGHGVEGVVASKKLVELIENFN